jgi:enolase
MIRLLKPTQAIIKKVVARQILDSRGLPTVACDLHVDDAVFSSFVPSGKSTGRYEAA